MKGAIVVPRKVLAGLEAIRLPTGEMPRLAEAVGLAREAGYRETSEWIEDNPEAYIEGGQRDFVSENATKAASAQPAWRAIEGSLPLLAVALHDGHAVREELAGLYALSPEERLREEDPHTAGWIPPGATGVVALRSRFEVDLNRPPERAVYLSPEYAWGLDVWREQPPGDVVERSLLIHEEFHLFLGDLLAGMVRRWGRILVLDLHSYNHRRGGPDAEPAPQEANPDVDLAVLESERERWAPAVDAFSSRMREVRIAGKALDVRENVKFPLGHFGEWVHARRPGAVLVLSLDVKKIFMDEWSGTLDKQAHSAIGEGIAAAAGAALAEL